MENTKKRITVTIPLEKEIEIKALKKERFKNASDSEVLRLLIEKGLEASEVGH